MQLPYKQSLNRLITNHKFFFYSFIYLLGISSLTLLVVLMKKFAKVSDISIFQILFIREAVIVLFLTPFMLKEQFNPFKADNFKVQILRHGLFAFSAFFWYGGIFLSPVNEMITMGFISQILAIIFASVLLKERLSKAIPFCAVMSFIGVIAMQYNKISMLDVTGHFVLKGYIFCLVAILIRGYIPILNKKLGNTARASHSNYMTHIVFLLCCSIFLPSFKSFPITTIPLLALCGFLYFLENALLIIANKHIPVYFLQLLDFSKIIFSVAFSFVFLGEKFTPNQMLGIIIIFSSYFIATRRKIDIK